MGWSMVWPKHPSSWSIQQVIALVHFKSFLLLMPLITLTMTEFLGTVGLSLSLSVNLTVCLCFA